MKKITGLCIFVLISYFFITGLIFNKTNMYEVPELLASSRSKEFCSCYFILKNSEEYCLEQVLKGYPLFDYKIEGRSISFSNHLYSSTSSVSKDVRYGCFFKK